MAKLNWRTIGWIALTTLPMAAAAQFTFNEDATGDQTGGSVQMGGASAFDLIHLDGLGPGVPLRKGNVIPGSERVQLNNQILQAGPDYGMDYVAGVVYIKRMMRPGMTLTVFYRYDDKKPQPSGDAVNGLGAYKMNLIPGRLNAIVGMGLAERNADGSVTTSNVFGFNSGLNFGGSSLNGLFLVNDRKAIDSQMLMGYSPDGNNTPTGKSTLLVQNFQTAIGKGSFHADYQDVSSNFNSFGSALAAGYDAKVVDQLAKEKGLKRMGFGFTDLSLGSIQLDQSFKSVSDGKSAVNWTNFGLKQGGFGFKYSSQHVGQGFTRFGDLAESDRDQLAKEAGMDRQSISAEFAQKFGKLSLTNDEIEDGSGGAITRRVLALDSKGLKFAFGDQNVDANFSKIGNILPNEKTMYGADVGVHRQWLALDTAFGGKTAPMHFATTNLSTDGGDFRSVDFSLGTKKWSVEHTTRDVGAGFTSFNALKADAGDNIKAIAAMYGDDVKLRPEDTNSFLSTSGVRHDFTKFSLQPWAGVGFLAQRMEIKTTSGAATVDTASVKGKGFAFDYRKQNLSSQFDPNSLMLFERDRLGTLPGLNRTDMSLSMDLGGAKKLEITKTDAGIGADGMSRETLSYADKKIDVQAHLRSVSPGFTMAGQMLDPEKDLLADLVGAKQRDVKVTWQVLPNLNVEGYLFDSSSDALSQQKRLRNLLLDWKPDKKTALSYAHYENHSNDPMQLLFANMIDRMSFFHDFGKLGKVSYLHEKQSFDGANATQPDSDKQSLTYEAQLDSKTSVRTEQTTTKFDNGDQEKTSANTVSTEISKRLGVSVTDMDVNRAGNDQDEKKRNVGFWFDFGHGIRFNYGYARQLNGDVGTTQLQTGFSGGDLGGWKLGDSGYTMNSWDQDGRVQATTKFALGTIKPFQFGFLHDISMNLGLDSAADRGQWLRDNKVFDFKAKIGSNQLGYGYKAQVAQDGQRGIDRVFEFKTDDSDKRWLRGSVFYKLRTMPDDKQVMIRNMNFTVRPSKHLEITNSIITNPEQPNSGVLLGSVPLADRKNSWKLEYKPSTKPDPYRNDFTFGATWDELVNDDKGTLTRTAGVTFKVAFANDRSVKADDPNRSGLQLFYGLEQNDSTSSRRLAQRYSLQYDQRSGPNQVFSFMVGNISYEHSIADGFHRDNWTARLDYQLRF